MIRNRLLKYLVFAVLLAAIPLSCTATLSAASGELITDIELGTTNPERNTTVAGSALLAMLAGVEVGEEEAEYIDKSGLYSFVYSDTVPASKITARMDGEGLHVNLQDWEYTAQNGKTVTWVPCSVTVNGVTKQVDGAGEYLYSGSFAGTNDFEISATYKTEFKIEAAFYNSLINYAYRDAAAVNALLLEYDAQKAEYDASVLAYEQYQQDLIDYNAQCKSYALYKAALVQYNNRLNNYNQYLELLAEYEIKKAEYDKYLDDYEEYKLKLAEYEAYCNALTAYNEQLVKYSNYLSGSAARVKRLYAMNTVYTREANGYSLYITLLGDAVDEVVARKQEIVDLGKVPAELIDIAGTSTEVLRPLLVQYENLNTDKERYLFYEENYEVLRSNLRDLYESLLDLFAESEVQLALNSKGKIDRYRRLLAQLYMIYTSIDDSRLRDDNWTLNEGGTVYSLDTILNKEYIISDNQNANPANYPGWPEEVEEPVKPDAVTKPTEPEKVDEPIKPYSVVDPGDPPEEVEEPVKPDEVAEPGDEPIPVSTTEQQKIIVTALREGRIAKRSEVTADVVIQKTAEVSKTINDINKHYVRFLNGKDVVLEYEISDGELLIIPEDVPTKAETDEFIYTFKCWEDEDGEPAAAVPVYSDLEFYTSFSFERKSYTVTWMVDGKKYTDSVEYGTVPEFLGVTDKPMTESKIYTFVGWDNLPARVTGDAVYTAQYSESDRLYEITWIVDGTSVTEKYKYNETPSFKGDTDKASDGVYIYTFEGWSSVLLPVTGNASYTAMYSSKGLVSSDSDDSVDGDDSGGSSLPITEENASYIVETNDKRIDVSTLYAEAIKQEYGVTVKSDSYTLSLSSGVVAEFADQGISKISVSTEGDEAALLIWDGSGALIEGGIELPLEYKYSDDTGAELFYAVGDKIMPLEIRDGKAVLYLSSGQKATIIKQYSASVTPSEYGDITLSSTKTESGEEIVIDRGRIEYGYIIKEISITSVLTGEPVELDLETMTFQMPVGGATVEVIYERQTFKITFVSEGQVISEKTYFLGDKVEIPADPVKEPSGKLTYTFSGWSPEVVVAEADAEYVAVFIETKLADEEEMNEYNYKGREYEWFILLGAVGAAVAGTVLICRHFKKKKKIKK